jgi:hypothetical protein
MQLPPHARYVRLYGFKGASFLKFFNQVTKISTRLIFTTNPFDNHALQFAEAPPIRARETKLQSRLCALQDTRFLELSFPCRGFAENETAITLSNIRKVLGYVCPGREKVFNFNISRVANY